MARNRCVPLVWMGPHCRPSIFPKGHLAPFLFGTLCEACAELKSKELESGVREVPRELRCFGYRIIRLRLLEFRVGFLTHCGWTKSILHHFETEVVGFYTRIESETRVSERWCEMVWSIHSIRHKGSRNHQVEWKRSFRNRFAQTAVGLDQGWATTS